jgi:hypothetical protein
MGKLLTVLIVLWAVALAISTQRAFYWFDVMDDITDEPFSGHPGARSMTPEEISDLNEADRMFGAWGAGGFALGYFGFNTLFMLWLRENHEKKRRGGGPVPMVPGTVKLLRPGNASHPFRVVTGHGSWKEGDPAGLGDRRSGGHGPRRPVPGN